MNTLDEELQKIRRRLSETDMTFVQIAELAGISWKTVSRIASGIEKNPRLKTAQMISNAIDEGERNDER